MLVENVTGSSKVSKEAPNPYKSWLNYWEVNANCVLNPNKHYYCPACGKLFKRENFDGCHVQKANNILDRKWYIVPLCSSCNQAVGTLDIGEIKMIPTPSNL